MTDNLSPEDRRKTMRAVKGQDTGLERRLYAMLAGMGLRGWRKHGADVLGKPDVVFPQAKVAVFVDGCFWHACPICARKLPDTNRSYWERKIARNADRDRRNTEALQADGWTVVRIWEHELRKGAQYAEARGRVREAVLGCSSDHV